MTDAPRTPRHLGCSAADRRAAQHGLLLPAVHPGELLPAVQPTQVALLLPAVQKVREAAAR